MPDNIKILQDALARVSKGIVYEQANKQDKLPLASKEITTEEADRLKALSSVEQQGSNLEARMTQANIAPEQFTDTRNLLEKGLNLPENQNWLFDIFDVINRPQQAIFNVIKQNYSNAGSDSGRAFLEGLTGKAEKVYGGELVRNLANIKDRPEGSVDWTDFAGFALDVFADPADFAFIPAKAVSTGVKSISKIAAKADDVIDGMKAGVEAFEAADDIRKATGIVTEDIIKQATKLGLDPKDYADMLARNTAKTEYEWSKSHRVFTDPSLANFMDPKAYAKGEELLKLVKEGDISVTEATKYLHKLSGIEPAANNAIRMSSRAKYLMNGLDSTSDELARIAAETANFIDGLEEADKLGYFGSLGKNYHLIKADEKLVSPTTLVMRSLWGTAKATGNVGVDVLEQAAKFAGVGDQLSQIELLLKNTFSAAGGLPKGLLRDAKEAFGKEGLTRMYAAEKMKVIEDIAQKAADEIGMDRKDVAVKLNQYYALKEMVGKRTMTVEQVLVGGDVFPFDIASYDKLSKYVKVPKGKTLQDVLPLIDIEGRKWIDLTNFSMANVIRKKGVNIQDLVNVPQILTSDQVDELTKFFDDNPAFQQAYGEFAVHWNDLMNKMSYYLDIPYASPAAYTRNSISADYEFKKMIEIQNKIDAKSAEKLGKSTFRGNPKAFSSRAYNVGTQEANIWSNAAMFARQKNNLIDTTEDLLKFKPSSEMAMDLAKEFDNGNKLFTPVVRRVLSAMAETNMKPIKDEIIKQLNEKFDVADSGVKVETDLNPFRTFSRNGIKATKLTDILADDEINELVWFKKNANEEQINAFINKFGQSEFDLIPETELAIPVSETTGRVLNDDFKKIFEDIKVTEQTNILNPQELPYTQRKTYETLVAQEDQQITQIVSDILAKKEGWSKDYTPEQLTDIVTKQIRTYGSDAYLRSTMPSRIKQLDYAMEDLVSFSQTDTAKNIASATTDEEKITALKGIESDPNIPASIKQDYIDNIKPKIDEYEASIPQKDVGIHYGDLQAENRPESWINQSRSERSTGHFGTGTYLLGEGVDAGDYAERTKNVIDMSQYNLYKPENEKVGKDVHEFLKKFNTSFSDNTSGIFSHEVNDIKNIVKLINEKPEYMAELKAAIDHPTYINKDLVKLMPENVKRLVSTLTTDRRYIAIADRDRLTEKLSNRLKEIYLTASMFDNSKISENVMNSLGIKNSDLPNLFESLYRASESYGKLGRDEINNLDSLSTVLMKKLGFEGVDVRGIKGLDNTRYGSVIYDIKKPELLAPQVKPIKMSKPKQWYKVASKKDLADKIGTEEANISRFLQNKIEKMSGSMETSIKPVLATVHWNKSTNKLTWTDTVSLFRFNIDIPFLPHSTEVENVMYPQTDKLFPKEFISEKGLDLKKLDTVINRPEEIDGLWDDLLNKKLVRPTEEQLDKITKYTYSGDINSANLIKRKLIKKYIESDGDPIVRFGELSFTGRRLKDMSDTIGNPGSFKFAGERKPVYTSSDVGDALLLPISRGGGIDVSSGLSERLKISDKYLDVTTDPYTSVTPKFKGSRLVETVSKNKLNPEIKKFHEKIAEYYKYAIRETKKIETGTRNFAFAESKVKDMIYSTGEKYKKNVAKLKKEEAIDLAKTERKLSKINITMGELKDGNLDEIAKRMSVEDQKRFKELTQAGVAKAKEEVKLLKESGDLTKENYKKVLEDLKAKYVTARQRSFIHSRVTIDYTPEELTALRFKQIDKIMSSVNSSTVKSIKSSGEVEPFLIKTDDQKELLKQLLTDAGETPKNIEKIMADGVIENNINAFLGSFQAQNLAKLEDKQKEAIDFMTRLAEEHPTFEEDVLYSIDEYIDRFAREGRNAKIYKATLSHIAIGDIGDQNALIRYLPKTDIISVEEGETVDEAITRLKSMGYKERSKEAARHVPRGYKVVENPKALLAKMAASNALVKDPAIDNAIKWMSARIDPEKGSIIMESNLARLLMINPKEEAHAMLNLIDFSNSIFKRFKLMTLGFNIRNILGLFTNALLGGMNVDEMPQLLSEADDIFKQGTQLLKLNAVLTPQQWADEVTDEQKQLFEVYKKFVEGQFTLPVPFKEFRTRGLTGTASELQDLARKTLDDQGSESIQTILDMEGKSKLATMFQKPLDVINTASLANGWVNETADAYGRMMVLKKAMDPVNGKAYMDLLGVTDPIEAVRLVMFDPKNLSYNEETLRRLIPFYAFTKMNLAYHMHNIENNPSRYYRLIKGMRRSWQLAGVKEEDVDPYKLDQMYLPLPGATKDGKYYAIKANLPVSDLIEFVSDPLKRILGSMAPYVKAPFEMATNTVIFTGQPIERFKGEKSKTLPFLDKKTEYLLGQTGIDAPLRAISGIAGGSISSITGMIAEGDTYNTRMSRAYDKLNLLQDGVKNLKQRDIVLPELIKKEQQSIQNPKLSEVQMLLEELKKVK